MDRRWRVDGAGAEASLAGSYQASWKLSVFPPKEKNIWPHIRHEVDHGTICSIKLLVWGRFFAPNSQNSLNTGCACPVFRFVSTFVQSSAHPPPDTLFLSVILQGLFFSLAPWLHIHKSKLQSQSNEELQCIPLDSGTTMTHCCRQLGKGEWRQFDFAPSLL